MSRLFKSEEQKNNDNWSRTSTIVQKTGTTLAVRRLVFEESFGYIALIPIRLFFEGKDDDPRRFDGKLNPFLLVFLIAGIGRLKGYSYKIKVERWIWFSFSFIFFGMAILTAPIRVRYLAPILPAIIILAVLGIHNVHTTVAKYKYSFVKYSISLSVFLFLIASLFIYNANYLSERFEKLEPMTYISGQVSRNQYIEKRLPEYSLILYANTHLAPTDRILGLFLGQRRYYFEREITFNEDLLRRAVRLADSPHDILTYLRGSDITHIMVRIDLFLDWVSHSLSKAEIEKFETFLTAYTKEIKSSKGYGLFLLKD